jgi:hypothetical protein
MYRYIVTGDKLRRQGGVLVFKSVSEMVRIMSTITEDKWSRHSFVYQFSVLGEGTIEYNGCKIGQVKKDELIDCTDLLAEKLHIPKQLLELNLRYNRNMINLIEYGKKDSCS